MWGSHPFTVLREMNRGKAKGKKREERERKKKTLLKPVLTLGVFARKVFCSKRATLPVAQLLLNKTLADWINTFNVAVTGYLSCSSALARRCVLTCWLTSRVTQASCYSVYKRISARAQVIDSCKWMTKLEGITLARGYMNKSRFHISTRLHPKIQTRKLFS